MKRPARQGSEQVDGQEATRRAFIKHVGSAAAASLLADAGGLFAQQLAAPKDGKINQSEKAGANAPTDGAPIAACDGNPRTVVRVSSEKIIPLRVVQKIMLKNALSAGLRGLTGESNEADAWHRILAPDDVILLKFNQSAAERLGTTPPLVNAVLASLLSAGWGPERIVVLEAESADSPPLRLTRRPDMRWQDREVDFGACGKDAFMAALDQVSAIVNVPFLKTHHLATMTGCLKNLSHGLIRHPARFHAHGCDPAIGQIVASPPIRQKLRLNIVNALRVVFDGGPEATDEAIHTAGTLLIGCDPVACDAIGYGILNEIRSLRNMPPLLARAATPAQLSTAARLGVGEADTERIPLQLVEL